MRDWTKALLAAACAACLGCSDSATKLNTEPLSDEQKRQIAEDDKRIADEESGGRGAKLGGKPKPKKN
ncbi:MAG TPA: hypothetical protein VM529_01440 [Gemmata sp.]|nr:hypothetical protein [Gemmata sp.]